MLQELKKVILFSNMLGNVMADTEKNTDGRERLRVKTTLPLVLSDTKGHNNEYRLFEYM
jgi:hypothetical protein